MKLKDKTAIVTGATSGLGYAIALLFSAEGANVVAAGRNTEAGHKLVDEILHAGGEAVFVPTDVSKNEDVKKLVDSAAEKFGTVDILVNNAGLGVTRDIAELTEAEWDLVMDVNVKGHFLCAKYVIPLMRKQGKGVIINMSSVLGYLSLPDSAVYCTSKAAILGLTRSMALDVARDNIRVNVIVPGSIDTPMLWEGVSEEEFAEMAREVAEHEPVGRVGEPEEIARAALFLATDDSSFATGAPFIIDGGLLSRLATTR